MVRAPDGLDPAVRAAQPRARGGRRVRAAPDGRGDGRRDRVPLRRGRAPLRRERPERGPRDGRPVRPGAGARAPLRVGAPGGRDPAAGVAAGGAAAVPGGAGGGPVPAGRRRPLGRGLLRRPDASRRPPERGGRGRGRPRHRGRRDHGAAPERLARLRAGRGRAGDGGAPPEPLRRARRRRPGGDGRVRRRGGTDPSGTRAQGIRRRC